MKSILLMGDSPSVIPLKLFPHHHNFIFLVKRPPVEVVSPFKSELYKISLIEFCVESYHTSEYTLKNGQHITVSNGKIQHDLGDVEVLILLSPQKLPILISLREVYTLPHLTNSLNFVVGDVKIKMLPIT